jgi:Flp pilus assembly protein TadG
MRAAGIIGSIRGMLHKAIRKRLIGVRRLVRVRTVRRLARREDGVAAVEFGLVAAPFLALLFAIIETALVFFAGQTLETATADAARLILTGQAQTAGFSQTQFKEAVCSRVFGLFNCMAGVKIDVRTAAAFNATNMSKPLDANGNLQGGMMYAPGNAGDIVVVRVMYEWPVYVSLLGLNLSDMSGSKRLLMATAAFRNEPYQ